MNRYKLIVTFLLCLIMGSTLECCSGGSILDNYDPNDPDNTGGTDKPETENPDATFPTEGVEVSNVLSAFHVGFSMIEKNGYVYMAYYDGEHQMTVARYHCETKKVEYKKLPSVIGWDTHNYVTMAFDKEGYLHVSGNMHATPLVYFRGTTPHDIQSLQTIHKMIGDETEKRTTYPTFMDSPDGNLIFHFRDGGSGNGEEIYNIYDVNTKKWKRLLDKPLTDGEGERNAYMEGPELGPDGYYHLIWVWRDTPDCSTNHTVSYARSKNLLQWQTISGQETILPITLSKKEFYVDDTPAKGGLMNGGIALGFDSENRPVIGYHKYDEKGYNQLYVARYENENWKVQKLTNWDYRWEIGGISSVDNELRIWAPSVTEPLKLAMGYNHKKYGRGRQLFDEKSLKPLNKINFPLAYPPEYGKVTSTFPGMKPAVIMHGDYLLRWENLPTKGDKKPDGDLPQPSKMLLFKYK